MSLENINIRDANYDEIHAMKPTWWMRWGILSVFMIVLILLFLGYFIKYPDLIYSEARLTTNQPSTELQIPLRSQLSNLMVNDGESIVKNQTLAVLDNDGHFKDILLLEKALHDFSFERDNLIKFFEDFSTLNLQLGSIIENQWLLFSDELLEYYKIVELETYDNQIRYLGAEIKRQQELKTKYSQLIQQDISEQKLLDNRLIVDSTLYKKGVISKMQYNESKRSFFANSKQLQQNDINLKRIDLEVTKMRNAIDNYGQNKEESLLAYNIGIKKILHQLKSSISNWKHKYLITSPIDGEVNFVQPIVAGKFYEGKIIVITPSEKEYYIQLKIPLNGAGKVEANQKVIIKLNDYPYREFGLLTGKINQVALVSGDEFYNATVRLEKSELSSYEKKINLKENMSGIGEIITTENSLLGRIFERILYAFHNDKT